MQLGMDMTGSPRSKLTNRHGSHSVSNLGGRYQRLYHSKSHYDVAPRSSSDENGKTVEVRDRRRLLDRILTHCVSTTLLTTSDGKHVGR